jgi:hypothetical protein
VSLVLSILQYNLDKHASGSQNAEFCEILD